ncbi:hypothetical protein WJX75_002000 [Coccomyxa subellipsoidea]|uniref:Uncharacterized protein n=1 Tax=Coccomyxa subellipsoidea TaxID=248742 RepID=A0ABR2YIW0_9CHLO
MPKLYLHFLKWGPASGCSPTPFTSLTFTPTPSILSNLTGGRTEGTQAIRTIWAGKVDAPLVPASSGYLADSQEWDWVLLLEYPHGASLRPEDFAREVAKDRFWLELMPFQGAESANALRENGGSEAWDAVTIVAYPSRTALRDALLSEGLRRQWADVGEVAIFAVLPAEGATARL